ncbi:DgyrCDS1659 [Dimorphilus gyrociliatus]|uniref:DgyrCDS1659 n=1 Tax=Dimorphilus gyrociliatus TaxID=2664684 RepID=A0A7I8V7W3_9ANNE|nr:DgyrCDS1659 [Dimorphilus gyrociliatus]
MSRIAYAMGDSSFIEDLVAPCSSPASPRTPEIHIDLAALTLKLEMTEEKRPEVRPRDLTKPRELYRIPVPAGFYVKLPPIKKDEKRFFKSKDNWKALPIATSVPTTSIQNEVHLLNIPEKESDISSDLCSSSSSSRSTTSIKREIKKIELRPIDVSISITPKEVLRRRHHVQQVQEQLHNVLHQPKLSQRQNSTKKALRDEFLRQKSILGLHVRCPTDLMVQRKINSKSKTIPVRNKHTTEDNRSSNRPNCRIVNGLAVISSQWSPKREKKSEKLRKTSFEKLDKSYETPATKLFNVYIQNRTTDSFTRLNSNNYNES